MGAAELIEIAKLGLQVYFALSNAAGMTEDEKHKLLTSERERFEKNISKPLPTV